MTKQIRVKVEGLTQKGKNRIKEHGEWWFIVEHKNKNDLLESEQTQYLKWCKPDFVITLMEFV